MTGRDRFTYRRGAQSPVVSPVTKPDSPRILARPSPTLPIGQGLAKRAAERQDHACTC